MEIISEIEVSKQQHQAITTLRNRSFPEHQVQRSYYKQLPHMRALILQAITPYACAPTGTR